MDTASHNGSLACYAHPDIVAVETCSVCGKPLCVRCCVRSDHGVVCDEQEHRKLLENSILLMTLCTEFEADMVSRNLEIQGIRTTHFSTRAFKLRIGDHPGDEVRMFLLSGDKERALEVLNDLDLPVGTPNSRGSDGIGGNIG